MDVVAREQAGRSRGAAALLRDRRRSWALIFGLAVLLIAPVRARAEAEDRGVGTRALLYVLYWVQILIPSEIGAEAPASPLEPRLVVGWAYQIPLGLFTREVPGKDKLTGPLMRHRVVVAARLALSPDDDPETSDVRFRLRMGYRYRARHHGALAWYAGIGTTITGEAQPSISPEVGVHLGRDGISPGLQVGVQGDVHLDGEPARVVAFLAWTLW